MPQIVPLRIAALALLLTAVLPGAARPQADDAPWIMIHAQADPGGESILISGRTNLPDGVGIDLRIERRGTAADYSGRAQVQKGAFAGTIALPKAIVQGYYVIRVNCDPARNEPPPGEPRKVTKVVTTACPLVIGSAEEIAAAIQPTLKYYEQVLSDIQARFKTMEEEYKGLIKNYEAEGSPKVWEDKFGDTDAVIDTRLQELEDFKFQQVLPMFPMLHNQCVLACSQIKASYRKLQTGLASEILAYKEHELMKRQDYLDEARSEMAPYLTSMNAQIHLERTAGLRDSLVAIMYKLFWTYNNSQSTFNAARVNVTEEIKAAWPTLTQEWQDSLDEAEVALKGVKPDEIKKVHSDMAAVLKGIPDSLRKLWGLYTQVIVEGANYDSSHDNIHKQEELCFASIVPLLEALGFSRDVFDKRLDEHEGGAPPTYEGRSLAKFLQERLDGIGNVHDAEQLRTIDLLARFTDASLPLCREYLAGPGKQHVGGHKATPESAGETRHPASIAAAAIVLAQHKDPKGMQALIATLNNVGASATPPMPMSIELRRQAAMALGSLGTQDTDRAGIAGLLGERLAADTEPAIRAATAMGLQALRHAAGIPFLISALMDADLTVRKTAFGALSSLTRESLTYSADGDAGMRKGQMETIRNWWEANKDKIEIKAAPKPSPAAEKPPKK